MTGEPMRKKTREKLLHILYMLDIQRLAKDKTQTFVMFVNSPTVMLTVDRYIQDEVFIEQYISSEDNLPKIDTKYLHDTLLGMFEHVGEVDDKIKQFLDERWALSQIGTIERALLRIAVYELFWSEQEGLHPRAVSASILNLSKKYIDGKNVAFLQGFLSTITANDEKKLNKQQQRQRDDRYKPLDKQVQKKNQERLKQLKQQRKSLKKKDDF